MPYTGERAILDMLQNEEVKKYLQDSIVRNIYTTSDSIAHQCRILGFPTHITRPIRNHAANIATGLVAVRGLPKAQRNNAGEIMYGRILHVHDTDHICLIVTDQLCTPGELPEGISLLASRSKGARVPEEALQFDKL
jgi:hypothetical protein